ncbi:hypothetical protein M405DRAFT_819009 [Rhizopogon salebrosus TDB-379]|nr:hypothetical protein M405DRAFT_819009 [Rhizopogon salebrosus TDB-379]
MAYETDARNPQTPFEGKANNEWVSELTTKQLVKPFKNFEEDARSILECIERGMHWAVHTIKTLPAYSSIPGRLYPCRRRSKAQRLARISMMLTS